MATIKPPLKLQKHIKIVCIIFLVTYKNKMRLIRSNRSGCVGWANASLLLVLSFSILFGVVKSAAADIELLANTNFESGANGWQTYAVSSGVATSAGILSCPSFTNAHSGCWYAYVGDKTPSSTHARGVLRQDITIPNYATTLTLRFYLNITSAEGTITSYDTMDAEISTYPGDQTIATFGSWDNRNKDPNGNTKNYILQTLPINVSAYAGQIVIFKFYGQTDDSAYTTFRIDDVSLKATVPDPNLAPYNPNGWSDRIVVSKQSNSTIDDPNLTASDTLYVSWAGANFGAGPTLQTFYSSIFVDGGTASGIWSTPSSVNPNGAFSVTGYAIGTLSPGTHTIRLKVDSGLEIFESNENDNEYTKTITIGSSLSAPSNLTAASAATGIALTWQDNSSNENGFAIERRRVSDSTLTTFTVAANQTSYTDTTALLNVQYCYTVRATSGTGDSAKTSESCATYVAPGSNPIARITGDFRPVTGVKQFYGYNSTGSGTLSFYWSTTAGNSSTAQNPLLTFNSPGQYTISLTVSDAFGRSSGVAQSINVQGGNNGITPNSTTGADPVVLSSGNYIQNHVDLELPGKGFPFEFRRFYNSKFSDQTGRPLGFGWTFNYNARIQDAGTNVLVIQGDGSTWSFLSTNGIYVGELGLYDTLAKNNGVWMLTDKNQTVTRFDGTNGQLLSITDKNGNALACAYAGGVLSAITNSAGRVVTFATNSLGCIASMTDPIGRIIQFQYDAYTNLIGTIDANGKTNAYAYNTNHQMIEAFDARGNRYIHNDYDTNTFVVYQQCDAFTNWTYFAYDFTNRITIETNPLGRAAYHYFDDRLLETNMLDEAGNRQVFGFDTNRNRTLVQDKNGNQTRYGYDAIGNVTNKTDAYASVTSIQYDIRNNPTLRADALGNLTRFGYDANGNLTATTNAISLTSRVQYNANGLPLILTDPRGFSSTNQYDSQGNLTAATDARGAKTRYEYDAVGRQIRQIDPLNRTNGFFYDNNNNLLYTVDSLGFTNSSSYDANNNRTSTRNPRNASTASVFDLKDRLVSATDALTNVFSSSYDPLDRKISATDARGNSSYLTYDDIGNLIATTNALNQVVRFTFDPAGNQTSMIDATNNNVTNFFDALNRKYMSIDMLNHTNSAGYDALSRVIAATNENGQVTRFLYDPTGRLINVVDAASKSVFFGYDENGNRVRYTDPNGHTWTNVFDELNRVKEQDDPQGHKTFFSYDPAHNLTNKITANGDNIRYGYDADNRLTTIGYPTGPPVAFGYDSVGNRTNMTDSAGVTAWQFDLLNRLTSVTDAYGQTVANGYDQNGNRVSLTYPGNKVVQYGFDALNRMAALTNWQGGIVSYAYDSRGNLIGSTNANGTTVALGYDNADRLVTLANARADASVIASYALTLDAIGNHTQATHTQPLFPILSNQTNNYSYDADNRLLTIDSQTVTHNGNGDLTGISTNSFAYDFDDRLVQCSLTNGTGTFAYDGLGKRLARTVNGVGRHFVLDRMGALTQVLIETDTNNNPIAYYIYGLGLAERISASGTVLTYQFNIQGSTIALTDASGNITDSYAYDSFGVLANSDGDSPQPFRYLGRYGIVDDGTGLIHARARYFSPQLGRFLTKDPVTGKDSDGQSLNRYVYALNNALRYYDITGLSAVEGITSYSGLMCSDPNHQYLVGANNSVGAPGFLESLIPVWGSGRTAINACQTGYYLKCAGYGALAASDVFLVKSLVVSVVKIAEKATAEVGAESITVYRGVSGQHPQFQNAIKGEANPWGGHADPVLHNAGDNQSIFTSWTTDYKTAVSFSLQDGPGGVILKQNVTKSSLIRSPDMFNEFEFLRSGPINGAMPTILSQ